MIFHFVQSYSYLLSYYYANNESVRKAFHIRKVQNFFLHVISVRCPPGCRVVNTRVGNLLPRPCVRFPFPSLDLNAYYMTFKTNANLTCDIHQVLVVNKL